MEKNRVIVSIFGKEYSLVSEVDPEYIRKAASYLDSKMREVSESYPSINESRVAVLAALNIADELFRCREDLVNSSADEQHIGELARKLSEIL
jgi:cell division protein ZapA